jgi:hypothetical protein
MVRYREAAKGTAYKIRNMKHNFEKAAKEKHGNTVGATGLARPTALAHSLTMLFWRCSTNISDLQFLLIEILPLYNRFLLSE